jgi:hypothetical protein
MKIVIQLIFFLGIWGTALGQNIPSLETFVDSLELGEKGKFKVELNRFEKDDSNNHVVNIDFYRFTKDNWLKIQSFKIDKDPVIGCEPILYDYDGDNKLDFSFVSALAARGANEVRTLFIFDAKNENFIHVINSEMYPNIVYNPILKCMDSWAFHGGTTQSFLNLENDSLVAFVTIGIYGEERILKKYNKQGEVIESKTDSIENDGFPRYINYNPFEEYKIE